MSNNILKKKLHSNRGASLSIALLLFMVCAVLGSVILKSGTAASGRLADLAESDARYYSVTSAADLIADKLDGKSVTIIRERVGTSTVTNTFETVDGEIKNTSATPSGITYTYSENAGKCQFLYQNDDANALTSSQTKTILSDVAEQIFFTGRDTAADRWDAEPGLGDKVTTKYKFIFYDSSNKIYGVGSEILNGSNDGPLAVYITQTIQPNGNLVMTVSSEKPSSTQNDDTADDGFRIQLTFSRSTDTTTKTKSASTTTIGQKTKDSSGAITAFTQVETTKTTDTKTSITTWSLIEMKKVGM